MKYPEVMVIGLDGVTFDLIDPWIKEGKLPNLAQCINNGVRAPLRSTPLSNSAQAWSSFITGKNPGKHGIYDFFETKKDNYGIRFINASFRKGESLWKILSDAEKKVGVINVPITYPAEKINGFFISGLDAPGVDDENFCSPPDLLKSIKNAVGEYILEAGIWGHIRRGKPEIALEQLLKMIEVRTKAAKHLISTEHPDFFMVVFTASDKVQHHFWKYIDPKRSESKEYSGKIHTQAIEKVYRKLDESIGELLKETGENTTIFIMSDHGAGPSSNKTMYINNWLASTGFLQYKSSNGAGGITNKLLGKADYIVKKTLSRKAKERLLRYFSGLRNKVDSLLSLPGIEWNRTKAYSRENHPAIFINLKGREPEGIVSPGNEYNSVCEQIIKKLKGVTCPDSGKKIIGNIIKKKEVYHGPEFYRAPDIIFEWKNYDYVHRPSQPASKNNILKTLSPVEMEKSEHLNRPSGIHRDYGIILGQGNHLHKKITLSSDVNIMDIAPTILYRLGVSIPSDMDGKVLSDMFDEDFLSKNPIQRHETGSPPPSEKNNTIASPEETVGYTEDESKNIEERLKGLGYID